MTRPISARATPFCAQPHPHEPITARLPRRTTPTLIAQHRRASPRPAATGCADRGVADWEPVSPKSRRSGYRCGRVRPPPQMDVGFSRRSAEMTAATAMMYGSGLGPDRPFTTTRRVDTPSSLSADVELSTPWDLAQAPSTCPWPVDPNGLEDGRRAMDRFRTLGDGRWRSGEVRASPSLRVANLRKATARRAGKGG